MVSPIASVERLWLVVEVYTSSMGTVADGRLFILEGLGTVVVATCAFFVLPSEYLDPLSAFERLDMR